MRLYRPRLAGGGVVHSFDGDVEEMRALTGELDLYIGVNGCSMKTEENLRVIQEIPVDRLLLETDAPWCDIRPTHASFKYLHGGTWTAALPASKKKERFVMGEMVKGRNEPCSIRNVLTVVANIRNVDEVQLAEQVYQNTLRLFSKLAGPNN